MTTEFMLRKSDERTYLLLPFRYSCKGSGGLMDRCLPRNLGSWIRTPHGSQPRFLMWPQYWLVPGSGLESVLNKLWNLLHKRVKINMFKLDTILKLSIKEDSMSNWLIKYRKKYVSCWNALCEKDLLTIFSSFQNVYKCGLSHFYY